MPESSSCGVCGQAASQRCSKCKSLSYCSKEHQKQHWRLHKQICEMFVDLKQNPNSSSMLNGHSRDEAGRHQISSTMMEGAPSVPKPEDWRKGLSKGAAAEWLIDCYRMRVDDDFAWGGGLAIAGKQHGLYHPQCTPKLIAMDFLIFTKLATQHGCATLAHVTCLHMKLRSCAIITFVTHFSDSVNGVESTSLSDSMVDRHKTSMGIFPHNKIALHAGSARVCTSWACLVCAERHACMLILIIYARHARQHACWAAVCHRLPMCIS